MALADGGPSLSGMQLPSDFVKAVDHLQSILLLRSPPHSALSDEVWETSAFTVIKGKVLPKEVPSGQCWRWNQMRGHNTTFVPVLGFVTVAKLSSRKKARPGYPCPIHQSNECCIPSMKLWLFHSQEEDTSFFWCEKGCPKPFDCSAEDGLRLEDFYFLGSDMRPELAAELWPRHYSTIN
jgi:hypothetical protein